MKFVLAILVCVSSLAFAQSETSVSMPTPKNETAALRANINQGNMELGGTIGASYSRIGGAYFETSPTIKYFIIKNLALGITGYWSSSGGTAYADLGPAVTYYFWRGEQWAAYVGEDALYNISQNTMYYLSGERRPAWQSRTSLGTNYFITPEVAFGPRLIYTTNFTGSEEGFFTLLGSFSVYL
jgi:hypothetical protein